MAVELIKLREAKSNAAKGQATNNGSSIKISNNRSGNKKCC